MKTNNGKIKPKEVMKTTRQLVKWGTVAALGLTMASLPVLAADQSTGAKSHERTTTSDYTSTTDIQSGKMLGHVERANKLIGKEVLSSDNQKLGKLENIIVDLDSGKILYTVIGSGGVLGAGEKKFAVPPRAFNEVANENISLKVDKARFQGAPQFTREISKDEEIGKASFVNQVNQYFAQGIGDRISDTASSATTSSATEYKSVFKVDDLIGMKIKNSSDADLGKVDNVAVDLSNGHVVYVILSPAMGLKLGNEYFALPPNSLMTSPDRKVLTTDLTKEKLAGAPHFTKDNWASLSDKTWASQVYQYYGKRAYFDTGSRLQPTGRTGERTLPKSKD
jgi:sporulation protein YlmC with PRC-barrel domain